MDGPYLIRRDSTACNGPAYNQDPSSPTSAEITDKVAAHWHHRIDEPAAGSLVVNPLDVGVGSVDGDGGLGRERQQRLSAQPCAQVTRARFWFMVLVRGQ
jgi:hypothetical protein